MAYHLHPHPNEMMTSNLRSPRHETNGFWLLCIFLYDLSIYNTIAQEKHPHNFGKHYNDHTWLW
jgi:hypothetical protein